MVKLVWIDRKRYRALFRQAKIRDGNLIIKIDLPGHSQGMNVFLEFSEVDIQQIEEALASRDETSSRKEAT